MRELERKRKTKQIMYAPVTLVAIFILVILIGRGVVSVYDKAEISSARLDRAKSEYDALTTRQQALAKDVDFLKTDEGVDATIRSKFRVVKEGEEIAVIVNRDATSAPAVPKEPTWWEKFLRLF
jgi:cell division protein FtsB